MHPTKMKYFQSSRSILHPRCFLAIKSMEKRGMTLIEYAPEFYDEMLAVSGVTDLYKNIDEEVGGPT